MGSTQLTIHLYTSDGIYWGSLYKNTACQHQPFFVGLTIPRYVNNYHVRVICLTKTDGGGWQVEFEAFLKSKFLNEEQDFYQEIEDWCEAGFRKLY